MSTTAPDAAAITLHELPPEPWGVRLRRARELHGFTQEQAAARLADFVETTGATISRLEALDEAPATPKRRRLAWALCASYGVDPGALDLTESDRPPLVVVAGIFGRRWDDLRPIQGTPQIHVASSSVQLSLLGLAA